MPCSWLSLANEQNALTKCQDRKYFTLIFLAQQKNTTLHRLNFYSRRGGLFKCNLSAERLSREATEWADKGSWPLVWVWAVCGGLTTDLADTTTSRKTNFIVPPIVLELPLNNVHLLQITPSRCTVSLSAVQEYISSCINTFSKDQITT